MRALRDWLLLRLILKCASAAYQPKKAKEDACVRVGLDFGA